MEQAIGVLAERHRIKPRQAFEQLREAARSRGRKVIDIAGDVVASATNPLLQLPDELSRPRSAPVAARTSHLALSSACSFPALARPSAGARRAARVGTTSFPRLWVFSWG